MSVIICHVYKYLKTIHKVQRVVDAAEQGKKNPAGQCKVCSAQKNHSEAR